MEYFFPWKIPVSLVNVDLIMFYCILDFLSFIYLYFFFVYNFGLVCLVLMLLVK